MSVTEKETQGGIIGRLQQLISVVNSDVKTTLIIFLLIRSFYQDSSTSKRTTELDRRQEETEKFNQRKWEKDSEQEDRKIKIEETKLNIKYAKDTVVSH